MTLIGGDNEGVTSISIEALKEYYEAGEILERVEILHTESIEQEAKALLRGAVFDPANIICKFIFKDGGYYLASGFSIGYGGTGPKGLCDAIRLWYPDCLTGSIWDTDIPSMSAHKSYTWTPQDGFQEIAYEESPS